MGCAFPLVISSDFHMGKYRDDNHEEDAPYFILPFILLDLTSESCDLEMHFLMFLSSKLSQTKFHGLHRYGKRPRVNGALIFIPLSGVHRMISSSFKHLFVNINIHLCFHYAANWIRAVVTSIWAIFLAWAVVFTRDPRTV